MKKTLLSLLTVGVVGAIAFSATQAFFSDSETSTGNTFTAGEIDLKVDSACSYNGEPSDQCGTWDERNLTNEKFFNFTDVKPGDYGENTISLHVYDNDAYMCAVIDNMVDNDNGLTDPESDVDTTGGPGQGELSQELHFFAWADDGDNVWESGETPLFSNVEGPASDVLDGVVYPLYTPSNALPGDSTAYVGVYWCFGSLTANEGDHSLSCDGSASTNLTQSDSLFADISFYVEQARNNENFSCDNVGPLTRTKYVNLENKDQSWNVINDNTYGVIAFSDGADDFHGQVMGYNLDPTSRYQITLNGPGTCTATDDALAGAGSNLFESGYWNNGTNLEATCGTPGEGVLNMDLIGNEYTVQTDANGDFNHDFAFSLPTGTYSGIKVLVKKTLDPFVSPWTDPAAVHTTNLYELAPVSFTVN